MSRFSRFAPSTKPKAWKTKGNPKRQRGILRLLEKANITIHPLPPTSPANTARLTSSLENRIDDARSRDSGKSFL